MRSLWFRLLIISVSTVLGIGSSTNGNEETSPSVENYMEGEDVIINTLQEDYRNTFNHVHGFLSSLSHVMEQLNRRMESLETQLRESNENMKARDASLLTAIQSELGQSNENRKAAESSLLTAIQSELHQSIESMKARDTSLLPIIQSECRQSSEDRTTTDVSIATVFQGVEKFVTNGSMAKDQNNVTPLGYNKHSLAEPNLSTGTTFSGSPLAEISSRIPIPSNTSLKSVAVQVGCISKDQNNVTLFEYDRYASLKPMPGAGETFNGSTLAEISSRIPTSSDYPGVPQSVAVEFANRLDSTIDSFQIQQSGKIAVNLPPEQIPGNTKEAFTFNTGSTYPFVAFSYLIPDPTLRMVVYARSCGWTGRAFALAFLPPSLPISTYYSNPGSFGEYLESKGLPTGSENTILAKKDGFIAKAILKDDFKAIVRVELLEVPLC